MQDFQALLNHMQCHLLLINPQWEVMLSLCLPYTSTYSVYTQVKQYVNHNVASPGCQHKTFELWTPLALMAGYLVVNGLLLEQTT